MFNTVLEEYTYNLSIIDSMFYNIALEAETDTSIDDEQNKIQRSDTFFERLKVIMDKIVAMLQRTAQVISNMFQKVLLTDKGFKKELRDAEVNRKPLNGTKLITYTYVPEYLDGLNSKFKNIVSKVISNVDVQKTDESLPLNMSKDDFVKYIFKELNAPDNIDDMNIYFKFVREKFRGQKSEKTIMSSSVPQHIKIIDGYEKLNLSLNRDLAFFKSEINKINSSLKVTSKSPNVSDEDKKKLVSKLHNLSHLYNMYSSFCSIYMELKV